MQEWLGLLLMRPDRIEQQRLGLIMQELPGLLWKRPDRIGMVKFEPDYAGMARIIINEACQNGECRGWV